MDPFLLLLQLIPMQQLGLQLLNTQLIVTNPLTNPLKFFPLTIVTALDYQGLATIFLCPSSPDNQYFFATGQLLDVTDAKPTLESITLAPQDPQTFVTYIADFERLASLEKY